MLKIGITGSIASGKSAVEEFMKQEGAATLDTDKVVHELLKQDKNVIKKVRELFAPVDVVNQSCQIDRKKIGEIVFSDKQKLKELENILHPEVKRIVKDFFEENSDKELTAVCVPLLYEAGMENMFDFVIAVTADEDLRLQRLVETRGITKEQALKMIRAQSFGKEKLEKADFVLENNTSIEDLESNLKNILIKIKCYNN